MLTWKWRVFVVLNTLGALLATFGNLTATGITGLALPLAIILLLPGSIPVVLEIGPLGRSFDFLGAYGNHFACALTAVLINLVVWLAVGRLFRSARQRPAANRR